MRTFDEIFTIAADRKGGPEALEALLKTPPSPEEVAQRPLSDWLEEMARAIFQAGFNWKVIEAKWPGFQTAFEGFDVSKVAHYSDEDLDRLLSDKGVVRNGAKLSAVIDNARLLKELDAETGNASKHLAAWPAEDQIGLIGLFTKRGKRLGGATGQRVLRMMGRDSYIFSADVCARLIAEGVIDKAPPTSKKALTTVQDAFNTWRTESGRPMTQISQVLAFSVG